MTWLISSDWHLTDRPRDAYRFGIFPWLARMQRLYGTTATFILGDVTDQKDKHSSALVNALVDGMTELHPPVYVLMGNHDFIDPANPFFRFLSCVEGLHFVTEPTWLEEHKVALIPHQPDQVAFDKACKIIQPKARAVLCHATFEGAIAETGARLTGLRASLVSQLAPKAMVVAGDCHAPQKLVNGVIYVGAPYRVRFGDTYRPRVLLVKNGKQDDLYFPCQSKRTLRIKNHEELLHNEELHRGDQVKIVLELAREEAVEWATKKQQVLATCKKLGLEVFGCEAQISSGKQQDCSTVTPKSKAPKDVLLAFCKSENVASVIKRTGLELLESV